MDPELSEADIEAIYKLVDQINKSNEQWKRKEEFRRAEAANRAASMDEKFNRIMALLENMMPIPVSESEEGCESPKGGPQAPGLEVAVPTKLLPEEVGPKQSLIRPQVQLAQDGCEPNQVICLPKAVRVEVPRISAIDFSSLLMMNVTEIREDCFESKFSVSNCFSDFCLLPVCENASVRVISVFMKSIPTVSSWCSIKTFQSVAISLSPPKKPPDFGLYNLFKHDGETHWKIIDILGSASKLDHARCLLLEMSEKSVPWDEGLFVKMIEIYGKAGLKQGGTAPGVITYNPLICGYHMVNKMEEAENMLTEMKAKGVGPNEISYISMIKEYLSVGHLDDALRLYQVICVHLQESVKSCDVYLVHPTCSLANEKLMELLIRYVAWRWALAKTRTAMISYFGCARDDMKTLGQSMSYCDILVESQHNSSPTLLTLISLALENLEKMSKDPRIYADIRERARDSLYRDYQNDHKFTLTTYTAIGVAIIALGTKEGDLFLADVATQLKNQNITTDSKVDTNSKLQAIIMDEPAPGLKTIFGFIVPDQKSGKVELQYWNEYAGINTSFGLPANPLINFYGVLRINVLSVSAPIHISGSPIDLEAKLQQLRDLKRVNQETLVVREVVAAFEVVNCNGVEMQCQGSTPNWLAVSTNLDEKTIFCFDPCGRFVSEGPHENANIKNVELGQGDAIAHNLRTMFDLKALIVTIVRSEGTYVGVLSTCCANKLLMLGNVDFYAVNSEACTVLWWKNAKATPTAVEKLKFFAEVLRKLHIADDIIPEPLGDAPADSFWTSLHIKDATEELLRHRMLESRKIGGFQEGILIDPKKKANMKKKKEPTSTRTPDHKLETEVEHLKKEIVKAKDSSAKKLELTINRAVVIKWLHEIVKTGASNFIVLGEELQKKNLRTKYEIESKLAFGLKSLNLDAEIIGDIREVQWATLQLDFQFPRQQLDPTFSAEDKTKMEKSVMIPKADNKCYMFSSPRPPEDSNLEDKVVEKEGSNDAIQAHELAVEGSRMTAGGSGLANNERE